MYEWFNRTLRIRNNKNKFKKNYPKYSIRRKCLVSKPHLGCNVSNARVWLRFALSCIEWKCCPGMRSQNVEDISSSRARNETKTKNTDSQFLLALNVRSRKESNLPLRLCSYESGISHVCRHMNNYTSV